MTCFRELARALSLRAQDSDLADIGGSYFKAMRRFPLERVRIGADKCLEKCQRFPKPAEWIGYIPAFVPGAEIRELTPREITEWLRAERLRWDEEDPCHCEGCRAAGVDHRFPRFVPEFLEDGREHLVRIGNRVITRGHWAHGEELRRYYAARDRFWAKFGTALDRKTMQRKKRTRIPFAQRLEEIYNRPARKAKLEQRINEAQE